MTRTIITKSEANQVFRAVKRSGGNFDTIASRVLIERLADKIARKTPALNGINTEDRKLAAAIFLGSGNIAPDYLRAAIDMDVIDKKNPILKYDIQSPIEAWKSKLSMTNFADMLGRASSEKARLASAIQTSLEKCFKVIDVVRKYWEA